MWPGNAIGSQGDGDKFNFEKPRLPESFEKACMQECSRNAHDHS